MRATSIAPRRTEDLSITLHDDGTVSYWSVHEQRWRRDRASSITHRDLAAMNDEERERIHAHARATAGGYLDMVQGDTVRRLAHAGAPVDYRLGDPIPGWDGWTPVEIVETREAVVVGGGGRQSRRGRSYW